MKTVGKAVAASLVMLLVGCGEDQGDIEAPTDPANTAATPDSTTTAVQSAPSVHEVIAVDYGFINVPGTINAGDSLRLISESESEAHEIVAFRVADLDTPLDDLLPDPDAMAEIQPSFVLVALPGMQGIGVFGNGLINLPGRYILFCGVPTGADPVEFMRQARTSAGPPDVEGGDPHFVNGMYGEVIVQ